MTDEVRGGRGPSGPPWSVDLLADLHAGVLDREQSARLWAQVNVDPAAKAIVDALESVRTGLGDLGSAPVAPMPARFAASLDAALDAEARRSGGGVTVAPPPQPGLAPVVDLATARRKRNRMAAWAGGLLTAAAAAVAISISVVPNSTPGVPNALPPSEQTQSSPTAGEEAPLAVTSSDLGGAVGKVGTTKEYGELKDQAGLDKCLAANGVSPKAQTIGVRPATLDGKPGTMAILLPGEPGQLGKVQVLVLKRDCTALANTIIG